MLSRLWFRKAAVTAAAAFVLAFVAACGGPAAPAAPSGDTAAPSGEAAAPAAGSGEITRAETLILQRGGNVINNFDQMNPYGLGGLGVVRDTLNKTIYEFLFLYNHNSGEIMPWLATDFEYNDTFDEIVIHLREGVTWSDGEPFTAHDIKYTFDLIKATPTMVFSAQINDSVAEVEAVDDLTVRIALSKPNPRWVFSFLAENSEINLAILPQHIWEGQDVETFSNFDLEKGWPVGTGPFRLVRASDQQLMYEVREDWWAATTGFHELPKVKRIIRIPGGDAAGATRLFAQNEVDFGGALQKGDFEAARGRNPNLVSWNPEGPTWGTADACTYILGLNNDVHPYNIREVRWAINRAIDRSRLITLGYEDSTVPMVIPLSSFQGVLDYQDKIQDLLDKYNVDHQDLAEVDELMTGAGFSKDAEGFWADSDGQRMVMTISSVGGLRPMGPPLAEQLRAAGFDAIARHDDTGQITNNVRDGTQETYLDPHCGAAREPYPTFSHFHSKYYAPVGESTPFRWANTRYQNAEYDVILDQMEALQPSVDDDEYISLFRQAADIWLNDLPEIVLAEERHVWTYNTACWTGWPNSENPYIAPYDVWGAFLLAILNLEPTGNCQ
jgi:peptide/nickel transport system substrate-binding protein